MDEKITFGMQTVGMNPDSTPCVHHIKSSFAIIIDQLNDYREAQGRTEGARLASIAITEAEGACMWAVKALNKGE